MQRVTEEEFISADMDNRIYRRCAIGKVTPKPDRHADRVERWKANPVIRKVFSDPPIPLDQRELPGALPYVPMVATA